MVIKISVTQNINCINYVHIVVVSLLCREMVHVANVK